MIAHARYEIGTSTLIHRCSQCLTSAIEYSAQQQVPLPMHWREERQMGVRSRKWVNVDFICQCCGDYGSEIPWWEQENIPSSHSRRSNPERPLRSVKEPPDWMKLHVDHLPQWLMPMLRVHEGDPFRKGEHLRQNFYGLEVARLIENPTTTEKLRHQFDYGHASDVQTGSLHAMAGPVSYAAGVRRSCTDCNRSVHWNTGPCLVDHARYNDYDIEFGCGNCDLCFAPMGRPELARPPVRKMSQIPW